MNTKMNVEKWSPSVAGLNVTPQKMHLSLSLEPVGVTINGNRIFADVIKLRILR